MATRLAIFGLKNANKSLCFNTKQVAPIMARSFAAPAGSFNENVRRKQDMFGMNNGAPVHLKGGVLDSILYRLTMGLCILGLGMMFAGIAELSKK